MEANKQLRRKQIALSVFASCLSRLFFFFLYDFRLEGHEWSVMAKNLAEGKGYLFFWEWTGAPLHAFGYPGIPYLFSILGVYRQEAWPVFLIYQLSLGALATAMTYFAALRLTQSERTAFVAALFFACDPSLALYGSIKVQETSLLIVLILSGFFLVARQRPLTLGLFLGAAIYFRPPIILLLPAYLFASRHVKTLDRALFLRLSLAALLAASLAMPWICRNKVRTGTWMFSSQNTYSFWKGNHGNATGGSLDADGRSLLATSGFDEKTHMMDEVARRNFFADEAFRWIANNPKDFIVKTISKFAYFWWFPPTAGILYTPGWLATYKAMYGLFGFFALIGVITTWRKKNNLQPFPFLTFFYFALLYSLTQSFLYVEGRHRLVLLPFIAICAAAGWRWIWNKRTWPARATT